MTLAGKYTNGAIFKSGAIQNRPIFFRVDRRSSRCLKYVSGVISIAPIFACWVVCELVYSVLKITRKSAQMGRFYRPTT